MEGPEESENGLNLGSKEGREPEKVISGRGFGGKVG